MNERTKSFYKKKFDDLRQYTYNFIPQEDEIFKQCNGITEPPYWFISNYGRLFSVYYKNEPLKQIRVNYTKSGTERKQHDWSYVTQYKGKQREPRLHRLVAKYFCKNGYMISTGIMAINIFAASSDWLFSFIACAICSTFILE